MALLGILEGGRSISAPYAIGGEWTLDFDSAGTCASGAAKLRQPALSVSQSGTQGLITLNDGRLTTIDATIEGATVSAKSLIATIGGKPGERTLEGTMNFDGCAPAHFRAVRQVARKRGE